jgi:hypothetical protein
VYENEIDRVGPMKTMHAKSPKISSITLCMGVFGSIPVMAGEFTQIGKIAICINRPIALQNFANTLQEKSKP